TPPHLTSPPFPTRRSSDLLGVRGRHQGEQHRERDRDLRPGRCARVDVPDRISELLLELLPLVGLEILLIFIDVPRDHVEIKPLRSEEHTSELQSLTNLVCR